MQIKYKLKIDYLRQIVPYTGSVSSLTFVIGVISLLVVNRESSMLYFRKQKGQFNDTCDLRQNLSGCQEAEKEGTGSPTNSCNFRKHHARIQEFFLLFPIVED